jgi:hypothetical protein
MVVWMFDLAEFVGFVLVGSYSLREPQQQVQRIQQARWWKQVKTAELPKARESLCDKDRPSLE